MARSNPIAQQLPVTDVHDILTVPRRRRLIRELASRDVDEWTDLEALAEEIVDEDGVPGDDTVTEVAECLEWEDLPLLDNRGVVEYELASDKVQPGEYFETVASVDAATQTILAPDE